MIRRRHGLGKLSAGFEPFTFMAAPGKPIRSIPPSTIRRSESPASKIANLMLDEPPLIVRMRWVSGFHGRPHRNSAIRMKPISPRGFVIRVNDAANPQFLGDVNEHRRVRDIDHLAMGA